MKKNVFALDELEMAIQLVQVDNPDLKFATYAKLKEVVDEEFNTDVKIEDIYLLHEPSITQDQIDMEIHYGCMFNITRNEQYY